MAKFYTSRSGRQFAASKIVFSRWNDYPYGVWTCKDDRSVLFNRFYEPIKQRVGLGEVEDANPEEWIKDIIKQEFFYNDTGTEKSKLTAATQAFKAWSEYKLPKLVT